MTTRTLDSKGRLTLGPEFANRLVIVDDSDATRIVITPATAVPSHEAWLYKNDAALKSVLMGLHQARGGELASNPPDVDADCEDG